MTQLMSAGAHRLLTPGEWSALSPGLAHALKERDVEPVIVARPSILARIGRLWLGQTPIMALGSCIYWAGALQDMASPWTARRMSILQHELQHVLEWATGELDAVRYAINPRNWTYRYALTPKSRWSDFGAEQRASIAEHLWLIEHGLIADEVGGALHRRVLPWAQASSS